MFCKRQEGENLDDLNEYNLCNPPSRLSQIELPWRTLYVLLFQVLELVRRRHVELQDLTTSDTQGLIVEQDQERSVPEIASLH
jgi:hypothetical protein